MPLSSLFNPSATRAPRRRFGNPLSGQSSSYQVTSGSLASSIRARNALLAGRRNYAGPPLGGGAGRNADFSPVVGQNPWQPRLWGGPPGSPMPQIARDQFGGAIPQATAQNNILAEALLGQRTPQGITPLSAGPDRLGQIYAYNDQRQAALAALMGGDTGGYQALSPGALAGPTAGAPENQERMQTARASAQARRQERLGGFLPGADRRALVTAKAQGRRISPLQAQFERMLSGGEQLTPDQQAAAFGGEYSPFSQRLAALTGLAQSYAGSEAGPPQQVVNPLMEVMGLGSGLAGQNPMETVTSGMLPADAEALSQAIQSGDRKKAVEIMRRSGISPSSPEAQTILPRPRRTWTAWWDRAGETARDYGLGSALADPAGFLGVVSAPPPEVTGLSPKTRKWFERANPSLRRIR